jgi:hypothetical protein
LDQEIWCGKHLKGAKVDPQFVHHQVEMLFAPDQGQADVVSS